MDIIPFTDKLNQNELKYIRETTWKLKVKLKEHITDIKYNKPFTAVSKLNQKQDIDIIFKNTINVDHTSNCYISILRTYYISTSKTHTKIILLTAFK